MMRIISRIDQSGDGEIDVVRLEHATAAEIVRVVNALSASATAEGGAGARLVADDRTNSVLVGGEASQRLRLRTLVTHLDTPLEAGGDTQVRYLRYADAEKIAAKLKEQVQGTGAAQPGQAGPAAADRSVTIWAEPQTNALVITAPPKTMRTLMQVVDQLDIRRAQVLVEALIVEVSADATADLGVNWLVDGSGDNFLVGMFNQPVGGVSLTDIAKAIDDPSSVTSAPSGLTLGGARVQDSGTNFAAILRALRGDGNTNIVSVPSIITLDNEEAQIKVAQEVPFVTGQFTSTGAAQGQLNPFQTIQREEVGTILKITPQITADDTILVKIEQEASSLAADSRGAVDLITNKRTISTRVLVDDGGMIVLGGLISDSLQESEQRVPGIGRIPLLGELFRVRSSRKIKTNLLVFIRPRVLRDAEAAAIATNSKYNFIRDQQQQRNGGRVQLLPGAQQPLLPPLVGPTAPPAPGIATAPDDGRE
jgi:general secretion pathway protein D